MSSKSRSGPGEHAAAVGEHERGLRGMLRRFVLGVTSSSLWQVIGHTLLDGTVETRDVEPFTGIGFYSRPPASGGNPEVVAVFVGGAEQPIIVAARDEATRQAVAQLEADETAIFTSKAMIRIKADGTVEIATVGGISKALATKDDIDTLAGWAATHQHPAPGGSTGVPATTPPSAVGTLKTKAE